jgi:superfamily II DNA or RNA helicase
MTTDLRLYRHPQHDACEWATLGGSNDFGIQVVDLARPPRRFWLTDEQVPPSVIRRVSVRQVSPLTMPSALLAALPENDNWQALTRRSISRLQAWFLLAEDPQRRLDRSQVASLAHQASLVRHVLSEPNLQSVLIADEVGLGKTIEAGLILRELLAQDPKLRVLYLAPARLVRNVEREFRLLELGFRIWVAGGDSDARLTDARVIASIHRAVAPAHREPFAKTQWDVIVVDECHHLSDYSSEGNSPKRKMKLVDELRDRMGPDGRFLLLSGTPHQGHRNRFNNLLALLRRAGEKATPPGRVIYRTKDDVVDWDGRPLFPKREVRKPIVVDLGAEHRHWLESIHRYFEPSSAMKQSEAGRRAATWRCAQALQWATSSIEAGLGYLVRQGIRADWGLELPAMREALLALRPYRGGSPTEAAQDLFERMRREVGRQVREDDVDDIEEYDDDEDEEGAAPWKPDAKKLSSLLTQGVQLRAASGDAKWQKLDQHVLLPAGDEKVVLFAQPIETVSALAAYLERKTGRRAALIVGNQDDAARTAEIDAFWRENGPQYLISSRAGGEGLNLQVARRLVHVDVPWNPMEMEQRIGRVHRFKSRRTILVDTLVTKDSREADVYDVAREKLERIAHAVGGKDRSQAIFARVMALVPPDDLLQVMGRKPLAPLSPEDEKDVERLVTAGYELWDSFDKKYRDEQRKIRNLDAGQARWDDVSRLAVDHLGARPAEGYTALRFLVEGDDVVDASEQASVLRIGDTDFAVGDYGGMPIVGPNGKEAKLLGTNSEEISRLLKRFAFSDRSAGAAHVRWSDDTKQDMAALEGMQGLLFMARQTLRDSGYEPSEISLTLHAYGIDDTQVVELDGMTRALAVRALLDATVRQRPGEGIDPLIMRLQTEEQDKLLALARPTEDEITNQIRHVVFPLLAVVVG